MHVLQIIPFASCHHPLYICVPQASPHDRFSASPPRWAGGTLQAQQSPPSVRASQQQGDRVHLPGPAFPHAALVVGLLVVELVVAGVPAPGGGRDHGPGLPRRVVTWACGDNDGHKALSVPQGWRWDRPARQGSCHMCSGAPAFPANPINPSPGPQELR